ncbi:MAG: hypothetical protein ABI557_12510 [Aureliella sp.]
MKNRNFWQAKFDSSLHQLWGAILYFGVSVACLPNWSVGQETQERPREVAVASPDGDVLMQLKLKDAADQKAAATLGVFYRI